jgi:DNA primase
LDPDEYIQEEGVEAYQKALNESPGYFHWLAGRARERFDLKSPEGRSGAFQFLLPVIHRLPDKVERLAVAEDMAVALGVPKGMVLDEFRKAASERKATRYVEPAATVDPQEWILVKSLLTKSEIRKEVGPLLAQMDLPALLKTGRIVETILKMSADGETPVFATVSARLNDADRTIFSLLLRQKEDEIVRDEPSMEQAIQFVKKLASVRVQSQRDSLRQKIREAERSGDLVRALELNAELREMEQKR